MKTTKDKPKQIKEKPLKLKKKLNEFKFETQ